MDWSRSGGRLSEIISLYFLSPSVIISFGRALGWTRLGPARLGINHWPLGAPPFGRRRPEAMEGNVGAADRRPPDRADRLDLDPIRGHLLPMLTYGSADSSVLLVT